jgi:hypothetical protein
VAAGEPTNAAVMRAEALSRKKGHVGAVAFSRTGDPAMGDFTDAQVIKEVRRCAGGFERVIGGARVSMDR